LSFREYIAFEDRKTAFGKTEMRQLETIGQAIRPIIGIIQIELHGQNLIFLKLYNKYFFILLKKYKLKEFKNCKMS
jgi:hypothetical protein